MAIEKVSAPSGLNKAYRAIYREMKNGHVEFVRIEEVNKHEY
jgi:hypothetical protein